MLSSCMSRCLLFRDFKEKRNEKKNPEMAEVNTRKLTNLVLVK